MLRFLFCHLILFFAGIAPAQVLFPIPSSHSAEEKELNTDRVLDSVVNQIQWNKGGIVCVNDKFVTVDTLTTNKVRTVKDDSIALGRFLKKNQKKISSKEFWGITTSNGQRQRFYNGKLYLVWESPSPYIYKVAGEYRNWYYYSETMRSPLVPLTRRHVADAAIDPESRSILEEFIANNSLVSDSNTDRSSQEVTAQVSMDVVFVVFRVMLICLDVALDNHSHADPGGNTIKHETGRRR